MQVVWLTVVQACVPVTHWSKKLPSRDTGAGAGTLTCELLDSCECVLWQKMTWTRARAIGLYWLQQLLQGLTVRRARPPPSLSPLSAGCHGTCV
jgi:hypothetical protein